MGVTYFQVAWKDLKVTQDNETVVLDVTKEQIEAMPKVEKREGRWVAAAADDRDRPDRSGTPAPKTDDGAKQPMQPKTNPDQ
jgi:hypothetical protein